jgi:hypothetical protein
MAETRAAYKLWWKALEHLGKVRPATEDTQTDGTQKTQIVDSSGNAIGATSNAMDVNIKSGVTLEVNLDNANDDVLVYGFDGSANQKIKTHTDGSVQIKGIADTVTVSSATLTDGSQKTQVVAAGGANVDFATATKQDALLGKQFPNIGIHILTGTSAATAGTYTGFLVLEDAVISAITLTDNTKVTGTNNFAGITLSVGTFLEIPGGFSTLTLSSGSMILVKGA